MPLSRCNIYQRGTVCTFHYLQVWIADILVTWSIICILLKDSDLGSEVSVATVNHLKHSIRVFPAIWKVRVKKETLKRWVCSNKIPLIIYFYFNMFGTVPLSSLVIIWKCGQFVILNALCSREDVTPLSKVALILMKLFWKFWVQYLACIKGYREQTQQLGIFGIILLCKESSVASSQLSLRPLVHIHLHTSTYTHPLLQQEQVKHLDKGVHARWISWGHISSIW